MMSSTFLCSVIQADAAVEACTVQCDVIYADVVQTSTALCDVIHADVVTSIELCDVIHADEAKVVRGDEAMETSTELRQITDVDADGRKTPACNFLIFLFYIM